jgi:hypothetical protein
MPGYASAETKAAFTVSYTRFDGLVDPVAEFSSGGEGEACEVAGTASVERVAGPPGV